MMKTWWIAAVLVMGLIALSGSVGLAIPSLGGPTGIVTVPTASIAPMKTLDAAFSYQKATATSVVAAAGMYGSAPAVEQPEELRVYSLQALTGITEQAELWAAYSRVRDARDSHIWGLGAKMALPISRRLNGASVAIGASYQDWVDGLVTQTAAMYQGGAPGLVVTDGKVVKAYLVATKDLTELKGAKPEWAPRTGTHMLGTAGLMYLRVAPGIGESETLVRPFLGLEVKGSGDGTELGLEYRWKDDDLDAKAVFSAVLRYRCSADFTAEIGTSNAGPVGTGLDDSKAFIRVGYVIPMEAVY
jgi:subtilisin family serine protease